MPARVLMVALDGAENRLLDTWSADGTLPNLAALRARGAASRLEAPAGISDDGFWATVQFGVGTGVHGRFHWKQRLRNGKLGSAVLLDGDRKRFWDDLSENGHRVAVIDVPKCAAPRPINGIHLADWEVHGRSFKEPRSFPEGLAGEVVRRFGAAPPSRCGYELSGLADDEVVELVGHLSQGIAQKRAAALHYLQSEHWDAFIVGFKEAHCAGHALWDLVDETHPEHDHERNLALGEPIKRLMKELDAAVGDLIAAAGPSADVVVFSTTDFVPNGSLQHLMPEILHRIDRALPGGWFRLPFTRPRLEPMPYNENYAAVRVNGPESLADGAAALLQTLRDAETGVAAITRIDRPSRTTAGELAARLPDLLVHYRPGYIPPALVSDTLGRFEAELPVLRPGNHAPGVFAIGAGPRLASAGGPRSVEDFGPLLGRLLAEQAGAEPAH